MTGGRYYWIRTHIFWRRPAENLHYPQKGFGEMDSYVTPPLEWFWVSPHQRTGTGKC